MTSSYMLLQKAIPLMWHQQEYRGLNKNDQ